MDTLSFGDLIGKTIGQYRVICPIKETSKSLVLEAVDNLDRQVALKILKPGQSKERQEQFLREGKRLAAIGKHEKITTVYTAGQENGFSYIAMEFVNGNDLEEAIKSGKKFSLEEVLRIITSVVEAVSYSRSRDVEHHDIKLANIKARGEGSYVLDFGDRLSVDDNYNDNFAIGEVFDVLLKNCNIRKIPGSLEEIVKKAKHFSYNEPEEIGRAITGYRRSVNRRRFLKGVGAVGALAGLGYFGKRYFDYEGSIEKVVHEIESAKENTDEVTKDLFGELLTRIVNNKVKWLVESGKISRGKFPYATTSDGSWFLINGNYWSDGFWPGILWIAYETTKDEKFKEWAGEWTRAIKFDGKSDGCNDVRFYYSHAKAFDVTGEEFYREEALKAAERFSELYSKLYDKDFGKCEISTTEALTDCFLAHLDKDFVSAYEFSEVCKVKDSSASAIASSVLLDSNNKRYLDVAKKIVESLSSENYLSMEQTKYQGLLRHSCTKIGSPYSDSSLIYGDYFYLDALKKLKNKRGN